MKNGRAIGMSYKTQEAIKYRSDFTKYVVEEVRKQNWDLVPNKLQHFYVDVVFYFDKTGMDCNNYFKVMLDAITDTQLIWLDDDVVCERVQRIYYDSSDPRLEIFIHPVEYIGIFDNASQLETFKTNCIGCMRSNRNCSILKSAIEGRIREETKGQKCIKRKERKGKQNGKEKHNIGKGTRGVH